MATLLVLPQHECLSLTSWWQCGTRCPSVHPALRLGTTAWEEELDGAAQLDGAVAHSYPTLPLTLPCTAAPAAFPQAAAGRQQDCGAALGAETGRPPPARQ